MPPHGKPQHSDRFEQVVQVPVDENPGQQQAGQERRPAPRMQQQAQDGEDDDCSPQADQQRSYTHVELCLCIIKCQHSQHRVNRQKQWVKRDAFKFGHRTNYNLFIYHQFPPLPTELLQSARCEAAGGAEKYRLRGGNFGWSPAAATQQAVGSMLIYVLILTGSPRSSQIHHGAWAAITCIELSTRSLRIILPRSSP